MNQSVALRGNDLPANGDVFPPTSIFDINRFQQVMNIAEVMAKASLIPDHLKGQSNNLEERHEQTVGNCFLVANQAAAWRLDPFAVAQSTALVHGKMCYEGKLIRAVIKGILGFDLHFQHSGNETSMQYSVIVSDVPFEDDGSIRKGARTLAGDVGKWCTRGKSGGLNDNWAKDPWKMLRERGAREWCRAYESGLMMGVYTPDEFDAVEDAARSIQARDITPANDDNPLLDTRRQVTSSATAPLERMDPETGEILSERRTSNSVAAVKDLAVAARAAESAADTHRRETTKKADPERQVATQSVDAPAASVTASDKPAARADGGAASQSVSDLPPQQFEETVEEEPIVLTPDEAVMLRGYSDTLDGAADADGLQEMSKEFWEGKPPAEGTMAHRATFDIYRTHKSRLNGFISSEDARNKITAVVG